MKKSLSLLSLAVILLIGITSCSSNKNTPERVAKDWIDAYYDQNYAVVKHFSTKEMQHEIDAHIDSLPKRDSATGIMMSIIAIKSVKIKGKTALVEYRFKDLPAEAMPPVKLVNENDKWLVQM